MMNEQQQQQQQTNTFSYSPMSSSSPSIPYSMSSYDAMEKEQAGNIFLLPNDYDLGELTGDGFNIHNTDNNNNNNNNNNGFETKMSENFYNDIDGFLGRSPPKLQIYHLQKQFEDEILTKNDDKLSINHRYQINKSTRNEHPSATKSKSSASTSSIAGSSGSYHKNNNNVHLAKLKPKQSQHHQHHQHHHGSSSSSAAAATEQLPSFLLPHNIAPKQDIDLNLLQEAFNYKITIDDQQQQEQQQQQHRHQRQQSQDSSMSTGGGSGSGSGMAAERDRSYSHSNRGAVPVASPTNKRLKKIYCGQGSGLVNKLRSDTNQFFGGNNHNSGSNSNNNNNNNSGSSNSSRGGNSKQSTFNVSSAPLSSTKKPALDHESLIQNFQQGFALQQLQRELALSQEALQKTTLKMEDLVRDTLEGNPRRRR